MSRIGKRPITVVEGVQVQYSNRDFSAKGPKGEMNLEVHESVSFTQEENSIQVKWQKDEERAMAGTMRALISNYVKGVGEGFEKNIKLNGVGYRAKVQGNKITLNLGYSHPVEMEVPDGIKVTSEKPTELKLFGANKHELGQFAANLRSKRPPEPFKGKGIKYSNEFVFRKEGKKK